MADGTHISWSDATWNPVTESGTPDVPPALVYHVGKARAGRLAGWRRAQRDAGRNVRSLLTQGRRTWVWIGGAC